MLEHPAGCYNPEQWGNYINHLQAHGVVHVAYQSRLSGEAHEVPSAHCVSARESGLPLPRVNNRVDGTFYITGRIEAVSCS